jgi:transcriptional regulator with XRE-family HTH domain
MLRVKELCKLKRVSMTKLANKTGVTPSALSQNLKGHPNLDRLKEIADALGVPITALFGQPQNDVINCPYCGGKIKMSKEADKGISKDNVNDHQL